MNQHIERRAFSRKLQADQETLRCADEAMAALHTALVQMHALGDIKTARSLRATLVDLKTIQKLTQAKATAHRRELLALTH